MLRSSRVLQCRRLVWVPSKECRNRGCRNRECRNKDREYTNLACQE